MTDEREESEFNRLIDSFSRLIAQQSSDLSSGIRSIGDALDRAAERLSEGVASASGRTPIPRPSPRPEETSTRVSSMGVALVRVINDTSQAIPVRVIEEEEERGGGVGDFLGGLLGGIGSFAGNLIGGIVGGFTSPFTAVALGAELIIFVDRITELVQEIRRLSRGLLTGIARLLRGFFTSMHEAGIFPISRLIASILLLIDRGITLILTHIQPLLQWVSHVVEAVTGWIGRFVSRLGSWLSSVLNRLVPFLRDTLHYAVSSLRPLLRTILEYDVRPAVNRMVNDAIRSLLETLLSAFYGFIVALGNVIIYAGQYIAHQIGNLLDYIPGVDVNIPPPSGTISGRITEGFRTGREMGRTMAELIMGTRPTAPPETGGGEELEAPTIRVPGFGAEEIELPEVPETGPVLERLMGTVEERTVTAAGEAAAEAAGVPMTFNGDINVQINAETVDRENAEAVARSIASHVLEEIRRLTETERFARGLSTRSIV